MTIKVKNLFLLDSAWARKASGLFALLFLLLYPGWARSQSALLNSIVANGPVQAIQVLNNTVYLGGTFTAVGPRTGCAVPLDSTTGALLTGFPQVNGTVNAIISDGAGGWYIGGTFSCVNGIARANLAHILSNLSLDAAWNPSAGGVNALALYGTTLYIGGGFSLVNGSTRVGLAALDTATGNLLPWNPANSGEGIGCLVVSGSTLYVGGAAYTIGGQSRSGLAAFDLASGNLLPWNPMAGCATCHNPTSALLVNGSTVYAGQQLGLVALDANTGAQLAWNPNVYNGGGYYSVTGLALSGSTLYLAGSFTTVGSQPRNYLAAVDAGTAALLPWNPNSDPNNVITAVATSGTTVYTGGQIFVSGTGGPYTGSLAAYDGITGAALSWNPGMPSGSVGVLAVSGSTIYAGGGFASVGAQNRNGLAAMDIPSGTVLPWNPGLVQGNNYYQINALAASGSTLYVAGYFTTIGGQVRNSVAALDTATGSLLPWNPNVNGLVYALALLGNQVYLGGYFSAVGGQARGNIASVDGSTGSLLPWNPTGLTDVYGLRVSPQALYAVQYSSVEALDLNSGSVIWSDTGSTSKTLGLSGSTLYAGGNFATFNGSARGHLAALDPATGTLSTWNPNPSAAPTMGVDSLATDSSSVYAGGEFQSLGSQPTKYLAAVDVASGTVLSWNPNPDNFVLSLAVSPAGVFAGGNFKNVSCWPQSNFAMLQAPPTATLTATPTGTWFTTTPTNTWTATNSPTITNTPTPTFTSFFSNTPTPCGYPGLTCTPTYTSTFTSTNTPIFNTLTPTWTNTISSTSTFTPTSTLTPSSTFTSTASPTDTDSSTPTPSTTWTGTSAYTFTVTTCQTPTSTSTATPSPTATAGPGGSQPMVYPNPATGASVNVMIPFAASSSNLIRAKSLAGLSAPGNVRIQIYTTAHRKVRDMSFPMVQPGESVTLGLLDSWGAPLANGFYYLAVTTPNGPRSILKLMVTR